MSLAEQLVLNYCNTEILRTSFGTKSDNSYYRALLDLKAKQDAKLLVSNLEYAALPIGGTANYWSAAYGYYHVNFHYNFFNPEFVNKESLIDQFAEFLSIVDFTKCRESEVLNWRSSFDYFIRNYTSTLSETYVVKSKFISDILEIADPLSKRSKTDLALLDRTIYSKLFDNIIANCVDK